LERGRRFQQGHRLNVRGGRVKKPLSKTDLSAEFLKRLRTHKGCEGISGVILVKVDDPDYNWDFSVIEAEAADPAVVGAAVILVYDEMADEFEMVTLH
jgi:hypothetical protein